MSARLSHIVVTPKPNLSYFYSIEQRHHRLQAGVQLHEGQEVRRRHRRLPRHPREVPQLSKNPERNSREVQRQSQAMKGMKI